MVQHEARRKLEIRRLIRTSLSVGNKAWNKSELKVIPRNSRDVEGPFSAESGTPRSEKIEVRVAKLKAGGNEGGEMMGKFKKNMYEEWNVVVVAQDPTEGF